jgi:hypothetical protein
MKKSSDEAAKKAKAGKAKAVAVTKAGPNRRKTAEPKAKTTKTSKAQNASPKTEKKKREPCPDPLAYPPAGRPLLDLVLLAIIDAHPTKRTRSDPRWSNAERQRRLDQAKRILFGMAGSAGNAKVPDTFALIWMANEFERQSSVTYRELVSNATSNDNIFSFLPRARERVQITPIAREAAAQYYEKDTNAALRLEKKFRQKRDWFIGKLNEPDATDSLCLSHAQNFCRLLKITGLPVIPPKNIWS